MQELDNFAQAVTHARRTFEARKAELLDLNWKFWRAFEMLDLACQIDGEDWHELDRTFAECRPQLGAPGDFGYGTPCGEALRAVYDTWTLLVKSRSVPAAA
jgi:hypothetical protein